MFLRYGWQASSIYPMAGGPESDDWPTVRQAPFQPQLSWISKPMTSIDL